MNKTDTKPQKTEQWERRQQQMRNISKTWAVSKQVATWF